LEVRIGEAYAFDLPEALHSFSVTITEIQLQMTNGD